MWSNEYRGKEYQNVKYSTNFSYDVKKLRSFSLAELLLGAQIDPKFYDWLNSVIVLFELDLLCLSFYPIEVELENRFIAFVKINFAVWFIVEAFDLLFCVSDKWKRFVPLIFETNHRIEQVEVVSSDFYKRVIFSDDCFYWRPNLLSIEERITKIF